MIWAVLALLGIPVWFIGLVLLAVVRNRRQVRGTPGVFAFVARSGDGWARRPGYARWVSDVLIIHRGPALVRTAARHVTAAVDLGPPEPTPRHLGADPVELELRYVDGSTQRLAVAGDAADVARGPLGGAG